jgi:glycosyltransferase involved in cell wall biosynthesis
MRNNLFDKFFENFDKVVTPSKFMHPILSSVYPSLKGKLMSIPNGSYTQSEINKYVAKPITANKIKKVGFFGQLLADKGVYEFLSATETLFQDQMEFFVELCGGNLKLNSQEFQDKFNTKLTSIHDNYGKDKVKLTGEYKNQNVVELMSKFDILIFPSKWPETFSLVLSEALLSGATILVPEVGAFKERAKLYKDRVITYNFEDANSMAESLKFALTKTKLHTAIKISEDLSIEGMTKKYAALAK